MSEMLVLDLNTEDVTTFDLSLTGVLDREAKITLTVKQPSEWAQRLIDAYASRRVLTLSALVRGAKLRVEGDWIIRHLCIQIDQISALVESATPPELRIIRAEVSQRHPPLPAAAPPSP